MTKNEAIEKHRKMWNWLADNPGYAKGDYLEKFDKNVDLILGCYLCDYALRNCRVCPLKWPNGSCMTLDDDGLYDKWDKAMGYGAYAKAAEIARQIAQLPEREE